MPPPSRTSKTPSAHLSKSWTNSLFGGSWWRSDFEHLVSRFSLKIRRNSTLEHHEVELNDTICVCLARWLSWHGLLLLFWPFAAALIQSDQTFPFLLFIDCHLEGGGSSDMVSEFAGVITFYSTWCFNKKSVKLLQKASYIWLYPFSVSMHELEISNFQIFLCNVCQTMTGKHIIPEYSRLEHTSQGSTEKLSPLSRGMWKQLLIVTNLHISVWPRRKP